MDRKNLAKAIDGADIIEGSIEGGQLKMKTSAGDKTVAFNDVIAPNCVVCRLNNPVISDVMVGSPAPAKDFSTEYDKTIEFEKRTLPIAGTILQKKWKSAFVATPVVRPALLLLSCLFC